MTIDLDTATPYEITYHAMKAIENQAERQNDPRDKREYLRVARRLGSLWESIDNRLRSNRLNNFAKVVAKPSNRDETQPRNPVMPLSSKTFVS